MFYNKATKIRAIKITKLYIALRACNPNKKSRDKIIVTCTRKFEKVEGSKK